MNALDMLVVGVVVLSGLLAFARGFVKEVLSIASWLGATAAALYLAPFIRPFTERYLSSGKVADAVAAGIAFLLTLIVLSIITSRISRHVKRSSLSALDRTLGLIFGLGRGVLLVCIGFVALQWVLPKGGERPRWMTDSRTLPLVTSVTDEAMQLVPSSLLQKAQQLTPHASIENEVESAIRAYALPGAHSGGAGGAATYSAEDQQRLNQLFQQMQSSPEAQRQLNQYLQSHPGSQDQLNRMLQGGH